MTSDCHTELDISNRSIPISRSIVTYGDIDIAGITRSKFDMLTTRV